MPAKWLRKIAPRPDTLNRHKYPRYLQGLLDNPNLWYFNRDSVAKGTALGLFIMYIPTLGHMLLAALLAFFFRANVAIAMALVWIVNPITMLPVYGFAYALGAKILGHPLRPHIAHFHSWDVLKEIWEPMLLGCLICGSVLGLVGYCGIQLYWRCAVSRHWRLRRQRRRAYPPSNTP